MSTNKDLEKQLSKEHGKGSMVSDYATGFRLFKEIIYRKIKSKLPGTRARELTARALAFSQTNKDHFVIIGDGQKDKLYFSYREKFMEIDISSEFLHLNQQIIKKVITKDFTDKKEAEERVQEFMGILQTGIYNFINYLNKQEDKGQNNINQEK